MKQISLLLFLLLISQFNSQNVYTKEQVFDYLNGIDIPEETLISFKNVLADLFEEEYIFNEVIKNPPQPEFDKNYFKKVNFQESVKSINTTNLNFYQFYLELLKILAIIGDMHISFSFDFGLDKIMYSSPIILTIQKVDDIPKIFGVMNVGLGPLLYNFTNFDEISEIIQANADVPIESINGEDPFDFISNFRKEYLNLKGPHGNFKLKYSHQILAPFFNFFLFPFSMNDSSNVTVVYENGKNFTAEYIYLSNLNLSSSTDKHIMNEKVKSFMSKIKNKENLDKKLLINQLFNNNNKFIEQLNLLKLNQNDLEPDYTHEGIFSCKVDNDSHVNVFVCPSFNLTDYDEMSTCIELFDNNTYPIIIIMIFNGGGQITASQYLLELISSKYSFDFYGAMRKNKILIKDTEYLEIILDWFYTSDYETCEDADYKNLIKKDFTINYGNGVTDSYFGPFILNGRDFRTEIKEKKKKLKNKRNPTDILVYTDGFSYSAAAFFLKYLSYHGGGITAGYFLNPNLKNIIFDSGLSASAVMLGDALIESFEPTGYKELKNKIPIHFNSIPIVQTFYNPYNLSIPLEYEITPVDEMVNSYFSGQPQDYEEIVKYSLEIFEKYKTKCNPNNKRLVFVTNKCDGKFKNSYTHGGYICGDDGNWTDTCVPSYCDEGYFFDPLHKECIVDVCFKSSNPTPTPETKKKNYVLIVILVLVGVIIIILIILLIIFIRRRRRKNNDIENINKENLKEGLNV